MLSGVLALTFNLKIPPTALSLMAGASSVPPSCVYCSQAHSSGTCQTVSDPEGRKQILRTSERCFVCLRRNHLSRNCRSTGRCAKCRGRHHTSICPTLVPGTLMPTTSVTGTPMPATSVTETPMPATSVTGTPMPAMSVTRTPTSAAHPPLPGTPHVPTTTSPVCVNSHTPVLLQTAKATVCDATQPDTAPRVEVRALLDTGSQRSNVTTRLQEALGATF